MSDKLSDSVVRLMESVLVSINGMKEVAEAYVLFSLKNEKDKVVVVEDVLKKSLYQLNEIADDFKKWMIRTVAKDVLESGKTTMEEALMGKSNTGIESA